MFSLIVEGNGDAWESPPYSLPYGRFGEYSDDGVVGPVDLDDPETLTALTEAPALLMYEVGAGGPNVGVVRLGRVRNVVRRGKQVSFDFEADPCRGYLRRQELLERSAELGIATFERYRTHWAVKDGTLPRELVECATPELVQRTVESVAEEYVRALVEGRRRDARLHLPELEAFQPSVEKAQAMVAARLGSHAVPELLAAGGVGADERTRRQAIEDVLARDLGPDALPNDWCFSIAWFLGEYGSPTEDGVVRRHLEDCAGRLRDLAGSATSIEEVALALWMCARSRKLVGELRREIAVLIDLLVRRRNAEGFWEEDVEGSRIPAARTTALATVALQRLGDDRYHELLRANVRWLLDQVQGCGALPRYRGETEPDLLATTFCLEAVRRSDLAAELPHVLANGDAWIVAAQTTRGEWRAPGWDGDFVTAAVLGYLARRSDVLPQVDGFLLMARDFFRRAEELRLEGGANNRRLSAIAVVHAVEMFLYGVFERREDLGLSAYRDNGVETLGPREALGELERALQRIERLSQDQRLPMKDQLRSLIGRRDGIIHRAHEISETELDSGIRHARSFIEQLGYELLELNLLE